MKKIFLGFIVGTITATTFSVFGNIVNELIEVSKNANNITVLGETLNGDNFIYNDTTYVPIRAVAEALGAEVKYNNEKKSTDISFNKNHIVEDSVMTIEKESFDTSTSENVIKTVTQDGYIVTIDNAEPLQNSNVSVYVTSPEKAEFFGTIKYKSTNSSIPTTSTDDEYTFSIGRASIGYEVDVVIYVTHNGVTKEIVTSFIPQ